MDIFASFFSQKKSSSSRDRKRKKFPSSPSSSSSSSPSSPPSSPSRNWEHNVFPSFHGPDVRKGLLSHLLEKFKSKGIGSFIDNEIPRGESIGPELKRAIKGSQIAIVFLSKNYASSSWCLDELVEIMECRDLGQTVMTIFYKVDPTNVKKQTGDFGEVFTKTCEGQNEGKTETWRKALESVATIAGYHSKNWDDEAAMIEKIASDISRKLNISTPSPDFDGLIGMEAHMERMEQLLCLNLDKVRMIGIWGPPGIGKSTIARFLFNQLSNSFQQRAIMVNIKGDYPRPCLDEYNAKLKLQSQMLCQMLDHKDTVITHLGVAQERLKDKKVLLVLDDVDRVAQLDACAKKTRWFGPGSRIIIATQDLKLLKAHGINHIYEVNFPSDDEASQIFCMNAFGEKSPKYGFEEFLWKVTHRAGKLPLGLRVMGSYFRGLSKKEQWTKALPKLWTHLNNEEIESVLKFSYDALGDEEKDLFLHIACFFNDQCMENVEAHLAESFVDVRQGLHVLAEKSLISIEHGWIRMHNLLVQLGKEIVRKQSPHEPGQRQFLVDAKDICEVLSDNTTINRSVLGIDLRWDKLTITEIAFEGIPNLRFLRIHDHFDQPCIAFSGCLNYISPKLQILHWEYSLMTSLPLIVNLEFLVELTMPHGKFETLWKGTKLLRNLKWVDLSNSVNLKEVPDLSTATSLKKLNLKGCSNLVELTSIGNATHLEDLNLNGCYRLMKLHSSIGNAINLLELDLGYCISLVELPSSIGNATNLQKLDLNHCSSLVKLHASIGNATNLQVLDLKCCSNLVELPSSIGDATDLQYLDLSSCSSLVELPSSIGNATYLQYLDLSGCSSLVELPFCLGNTTNLQKLNLSYCSRLVELPSSIGNATSLQELNVQECSSLVTLPSSIGNLHNLQELDFSGCSSLVELPNSIGNSIYLQKLHFSRCSSLTNLPSFIGFATHSHELDLSYCSSLVELPSSIGNPTNFRILNLRYCSNLVKLPSSIGFATNLQKLDLSYCSSLVSLPRLPDSLFQLDAEHCESLESLDCSFSNPDIHLNFRCCFRLNQQARDFIIRTSTRKVVVLLGGEVPSYFTYRASGSSITVKLNENPIHTSTTFRVCILLDDEVDYEEDAMVHCTITSHQNDVSDSRSHHNIFLGQCLKKHLYIFNIEAGEVASTKLVFKFTLHSYTYTKGRDDDEQMYNFIKCSESKDKVLYFGLVEPKMALAWINDYAVSTNANGPEKAKSFDSVIERDSNLEDKRMLDTSSHSC